MERKLFRSDRDKKIFGVCGGLGEYFSQDPVLFRILFLTAFIAGSLGFWIYIIFALIMPKKENSGADESISAEPIKKLYRVKHGAVLFGVCGGFADYFGFDIVIYLKKCC